jgi:hypothetical protein
MRSSKKFVSEKKGLRGRYLHPWIVCLNMFKLSMLFTELYEFWLLPFSEDFAPIVVFTRDIFESGFY